jgi:hypothetical protein
MSNSILENLISSYDPEGVLSVVADNPDSLRATAKTASLVQGRRVPFRASVKDTEITAYATLRSAHLHRITVIDHTSKRTGNTSPLVTGIFKPVKMDIELVIGGEVLTIQEFLRLSTNATAETPATEEQFAATLEDLGFKFSTGMNLFFQQFGARQDGIDHLLESFQRAGAVDVFGSIKDPRRIKQAFQMPKGHDGLDLLGPEVISFDIGTSDRTQSQTEQGFLDFVDAITANHMRVVKLRKEASILKSSNAALSSAENWTSERKKAAAKEVTQLIRSSQQWASTWSGAQQRIEIDEKDPEMKTILDMYDPAMAPCGTFKMIVADETVSVDLWSNNTIANTSGSPVTSTVPQPAQADQQPLIWEEN